MSEDETVERVAKAIEAEIRVQLPHEEYVKAARASIKVMSRRAIMEETSK